MGSVEGSWRQAGGGLGKQSGKGGRKGYRSKSHQLEVVVREKMNCLAKLQSEKVFLKQKGSVLELLLEVASEVAVHKRQHTGTKFPELRDTQLLEFLEKFLDSYGGYAAERPTARNYFQLDKFDVEQYKDVQAEGFLEKYTSLVQRLSLLLLQATDDSMKGGLTTTIEDLKQLLLGTLLWSPLTFMQVGTHHLVSGEPIVPDPGHSAKGIAGIRLTQEQEDVLVIIGDLYNTQVASLESTHQNLCQQLDVELTQDNSSGSVAATIMCISSNMHRLLAIHQLFHVAIMHNLADQQLAHLCVRCFPRFPYMQDLLNALSKLRDTRGKGLDLPEVPDGVPRVGGGISLPGASSYLDRQPLQKPNPVEPSALGKGRASDSSKLLQYGSGLLSSSVAGLIKEESKSQAEAEQGSEAAAAEQAAPRSPVVDVVKGSAKDWDVQGSGCEEAGNSTPVRPDSSSAAPPASNQKGARSPGLAGGSSRMNTNSKGSKRPGSSAGTAAAAAYNGGSSTLNSKRNKPSSEEKWPKQQSRPSKDSADGMDVDLEAVVAAAAAGMPLDPAAAAALPVPLDTLPAQQRPSTVNPQAGLPSQLMQQLAAALSTAGAPTDIMQMLSAQPKLAAVLQQNPQLLGVLQEALVPQDQQQQQEPHDPWQQQQQQQSMHHATLPELLQAVAAGGPAALAALPAQQQQQQQSHGGSGRPPSAEAAMHQQQQWEAQHATYGVGQAGASRSNGLPALEMLPPSLMAKEAAGGSSALQALLKAVATLLQACSSVTEAAMAAADAGHGEFVASAVSTAEAALGAALKSLQDVKLQGSSKAYLSGSAAVPPPAVSYGAVGLSAPPAQRMGLPGAGPSASRLQPPAGIPMPGPHSSQQMLPQSLSMALSGMQLPLGADALPPHSSSGGPSQLHRSSSRAAGYSAQPPVHNSMATHGRTQQKPLHQQEQQQQQPSTAAAFMQQLASLGENPAAIAQLLQVLQQQQPSAELSALLVQVVSSAAVQGAIPDLASLAAMFTQQQPQVPAAVKRNTAAAALGAPAPSKKTPPPVYPPWQQGAKHADMYGGYEAATQQVLGAPAAASRAVPQAAAPPKLAPVSQPPAANSRDVMQYAPGYENPAAAAAAVAAAAAAVLSGPGTAAASDAAAAAAAPVPAGGGVARTGAEAKEDSPSAGSSTTITGQSGRQQNGTDTAADHTSQQPHSQQQKHEQQQPHGQQQKLEQQQLEGLARAAAAAMGSQLQGAGQAEAFISTVMQLLQGQGSADMASAGVNAVAGLLQAMTGPPTQQQQPGVNPAPAATATAPPMGQSPAAAATVVPPAAAAAMAAAKRPTGAAAGPKPVGALATAAAGGGGGGVRGHVQQAGPDLREADAMSALEMLASAAVHSQHQHEGAARKKVGARER